MSWTAVKSSEVSPVFGLVFFIFMYDVFHIYEKRPWKMRMLTSFGCRFFIVWKMSRRKSLQDKNDQKKKKKKKKCIKTDVIIFAFPPKPNGLTITIGSPSFVETRRLNSPFLPAEVPLSKHLTPSPADDPDLWPPGGADGGRRGDRTHRSITLLWSQLFVRWPWWWWSHVLTVSSPSPVRQVVLPLLLLLLLLLLHLLSFNPLQPNGFMPERVGLLY